MAVIPKILSLTKNFDFLHMTNFYMDLISLKIKKGM